MRILKSTGAALLALPLLAAGARAEPARFEIDPSHLSIVFNVEHLGYGAVWGMFLSGSGGFTYDEATQTLSDLEVKIDTTSVFTNDDARDNHLKSADFLNAEPHPVATFTMTGASAESDTEGTVTGDLTLRGETHPVTLDVTLNKIGPYPWGENYVVGITATTTLKRSDWGSTYALEGGLVGDDVPLVIELEAIRQ